MQIEIISSRYTEQKDNFYHYYNTVSIDWRFTVDGSATEVDSVNLIKKQHLPMLVKLLDEVGFI